MSEVKVNKISPRSGTAVTLGDSGDKFTVPSGSNITINSGASITNDGTATGFDTGLSYSEKTSSFSAVSGNAYIVNTSGGAITATLPSSASIGDQVHFIDGTGSFNTNNLIVNRNSKNIQGVAENLNVSIQRAGFSLIYYNATNGWILKDV